MVDGYRVLDQAGVAWFNGQWLAFTKSRVDEAYVEAWGIERSERGVLWTSADEHTWNEAASPPAILGDVFVQGPQLFAHNGSLAGDHLWCTPDLVDWELQQAADDTGSFVRPFYSDDLGHIGMADIAHQAADRDIRVVVSSDATTWTPLLETPQSAVDLIVAFDSRALFLTPSDDTGFWLLTLDE